MTHEKYATSKIAEAKAKAVLLPGDNVGCTKCPGTKRVFIFSHWDGHWMVSKSGIDDYSPASIYSLNGKYADFTANITAEQLASIPPFVPDIPPADAEGASGDHCPF